MCTGEMTEKTYKRRCFPIEEHTVLYVNKKNWKHFTTTFIYQSTTDDLRCRSINSMLNMSNSRQFSPPLTEGYASVRVMKKADVFLWSAEAQKKRGRPYLVTPSWSYRGECTLLDTKVQNKKNVEECRKSHFYIFFIFCGGRFMKKVHSLSRALLHSQSQHNTFLKQLMHTQMILVLSRTRKSTSLSIVLDRLQFTFIQYLFFCFYLRGCVTLMLKFEQVLSMFLY